MDHCRDEEFVGPRLHRFDHFPDALLEVDASDLWRHLAGPSLFHLTGRHAQPLFISVLLHGNEDTGWRAVQTVLRRHRGTILPRALILFVGNIEAAKAGVRTLPTQTDYNRGWPGTLNPTTPEAHLMREVVDIVRSHAPFASIDIHNNTGNNPHYACLNRLEDPFLQLATLFSRTVVYFNKPVGVQSAALATVCPAVTVECGRVGGTAGIEHAAEFIGSALALSQFPSHSVAEHDIDLLRTFAIVQIPPDVSFSYDGSDAEFRLRSDLDHLNFSELDPGTSFGCLGSSNTRRLDVLPGADFASADPYFDYTGGEIRLAQRAVPAMLTLDPDAVRLDCLGYLMHRIDRQGRRIVD
jgi:succinylglutamate desuccinylase